MQTLHVTLRPITPGDYERMVEIQQDQTHYANSLDDLKRNDELQQPGDIRNRLAACLADGTMVGYAVAVHDDLDHAGKFHLNVRVDRPYANNGVGPVLYEAVEKFALANGATVLQSSVRESDPKDWAWAQQRGYYLKNHLFESKRSLHDFDPSPFLESVTQAEAAGIRFGSFADYPQTDEWRMKLFDYFWELTKDIPGYEEQQKPPFALVKKGFFETPRWDSAGVILAIDGDKWAAMAHVQRQNNGELGNGLTAVSREYRGRGLALAVKIKSMEYAKQQGADYIRTNNHATNERMLAVNRKLGYQPEPGVYHIEKIVS